MRSFNRIVHRFTTSASRYLLVAVVGLGLMACKAVAQSPDTNGDSSPMTLTQAVQTMVEKNIERSRALEGYRSRRTYTLFYKGFPSDLHAQMVVDLTYTAPNTKTFTVVSQSGPKWIIDQVLMRLLKTETGAQQKKSRTKVDLNTKNYNFSDLQYQKEDDDCSYSVSVEPKNASKLLYRGRIWINDRDFAVCRIEAQPAKNPSFWITSTKISHVYEKVGAYWLPERNKSVSTIRLGGQATLTIQYQDYKLLTESTTYPAYTNRSASSSE